MTTALQLNFAEQHVDLITVTWGDSNVERYAKYEADITIAGDVYTAAPTLNIDNVRLTGGSELDTMDFVIGAGHDPFDALADPSEPHAPVTVLYSVASAVTSNTTRDIYSGIVARVEAVVPGEDDETFRITVHGIKRHLDVHLGVSGTDRCSWRFGDDRCGVDLDTIKLTGTAGTIDGQTVTVTFTGTPDLTAARWNRGTLVYDGLALTIQSNDGAGTFTMNQNVPASWDGETVDAYPGCDLRPETCRTVWANEENGGWLGYYMQDRYPLTESA